MRQFACRDRFKPQQGIQDKVGRFLKSPDRGSEQPIKNSQRADPAKRNSERIGNRSVFRTELTKNDVQEGDPDKGQGYRNGSNNGMRMNINQSEERLQNVGEKLFAYPA